MMPTDYGRYVLKNNETGMYVARSGSAKAYTNDRSQARVFASKEEALAEACGNESVWLSPSETPMGRG